MAAAKAKKRRRFRIDIVITFQSFWDQPKDTRLQLGRYLLERVFRDLVTVNFVKLSGRFVRIERVGARARDRQRAR